MYLKSLVLKGFKSFANRSVLALEPGITAVVGPNGSGKSNILDAVLWVLGERNARNLRGQAMEDVIFAGSSTRKKVSVAEVELVLDNSDGTLPVEYAEVCIARRMYRSGESEYLINGSQVRRLDVLDILHDSGLGTGTHSIISQGQLDSILQSKPEDRRALIEEAAGVLKHKQRKAKSERKLARMDQHLLRIRDITNEVERQLKPLERKAKRALQYQDLAAELATLTLTLSVDDLRRLQAQWDAICAREAALQAEGEQAQQAVSAADGSLDGLRNQLQEHTEGSSAISDSFHRMSNVSERLDSTVLLIREKRRSSARFHEEKRVRLEADKRRAIELEQELHQAEDRLTQVVGDSQEAEAKLAGAVVRQQTLTEKIASMEQDIVSADARQREVEAACEALRQAKELNAQALHSNESDAKLYTARQADLQQRLDSAQAQVDALMKEVLESDEALEQATAREAEVRVNLAAAQERVTALRAEFEAAQLAKSTLDAQVAGLEEGERTRQAENKALNALLTDRKKSGVLETLVSVIEAPQEASGLIEQLLGEAVNAAVFADRSTADVALHGLVAGSEKGSVVLVSEDMDTKSALPNGVDCTALMDVVSCPDRYRRIVQGFLGDVLVCKTAAEAVEIFASLPAQSSCRVASYDGLVIDEHGRRFFSRKDKSHVGAIERHRRLEEARVQCKAATKDLERATETLHEAEKALRALQKESLACGEASAHARGHNASLHSNMAELRDNVAVQQREFDELSELIEKTRKALEEIRPDTQRIEHDLVEKSAELEQLKATLTQTRAIVAPIRQELSAANEALAEARQHAALLQERRAYAERIVAARKRDGEEVAHRIEAATREVTGGDRVSSDIAPVLEALDKLRQATAVRIASLQTEMEQARTSSGTLQAQIEAARTASLAAHSTADAVQAALADVRVEKGRLEVQVESAVQVIREETDLPVERALEIPAPEDRAAEEQRAEKLRRRIANMGTINPDAAEEYEHLKERFDYLDSQVHDMMEARRALAKIVAVIDDRMKDDFIDTFAQVNQNFQEIFAELFPGGQANLSLVDPDDVEHTGVEVHAQPKGKRITKMSLLSGGEKSLTALALLFAVYRTRSTPFYILDEVEAALDDTNLRRLCTYLEDLRQKTQLIMITHQRRTMEMADVLYGISMQSDGVTKLVSQKLDRGTLVEKG